MIVTTKTQQPNAKASVSVYLNFKLPLIQDYVNKPSLVQ